MDKTDKVKVKVYLTKNKVIDEVRFFELPEDERTFNFLSTKIRNIFGIEQDIIKLYWQDADMDYITISSDEELQAAIRESCSQNTEKSLLNIYMTVKKNDNGGGGDDCHNGVICDVCDKLVKGIRHKCKVCPDYDLCTPCLSTGVHSNHEFQDIPPPNSRGFTFEFSTNGTDFNDYPGCPWPKGPRCRGGRGRFSFGSPRGRRNWFNQAPFEGPWARGSEEKPKNNGFPHPPPPPPPPPPFNWSFHPYVGVSTGVSSSTGGSAGGSAASYASSFPPDLQNVVEEATQFAENMASRHAADIIRGIWSAWEGHQGQGQRGFHQDNQGSPGAGPQRTSQPAARERPAGGCCSGSNTPRDESSQTCSEKPPAQDDARDGGERDSQRSQRDSSSPEMVVMDVDDCVPLPPQKKAQDDAPQKTSADDWTLLNKEGQGEQTQKAQKEQPPQEQPVKHPDERVRKALDHMRAMGYSDEGGWLTRLLEMKQGDINQVLDLLLVNRK